MRIHVYTMHTIKCDFLETKKANLFPKTKPILPPPPQGSHTPAVFDSKNLNCQLDFSFLSPTLVTINLLQFDIQVSYTPNFASRTPTTLSRKDWEGVPTSFML